jgi:NHLM bacteriocin system ABC transporter ATP-binding protein
VGARATKLAHDATERPTKAAADDADLPLNLIDAPLAAEAIGNRVLSRVTARNGVEQRLLNEALKSADSRRALSGSEHATGLPEIFAKVAIADGLRLPGDYASRVQTSSFSSVDDFAALAGFRTRSVALDDDWALKAGPALIGWLVPAEGSGQLQPVALVQRRGRYCIIKSEQAAPSPLTPELLARLFPTAQMLYPRLPDKATPRDMMRMMLDGAQGDLIPFAACAALAMLVGLVTPIIMSVLVGSALPEGDIGFVETMIVVMIAGAAGTAGLQAMRSFAIIRLFNRFQHRLQCALWARLLDLPTSFFRKELSGELAQRFSGVDAAFRMLGGSVISGLMAGLMSFAGLGLMLFYDIRLAVFGLCFGLAAAGLMFGIGWFQVRVLAASVAARGKVSGELVQLLGGLVKIRLAAAEERVFARWAAMLCTHPRPDRQVGRLAAVQGIFGDALMPVATLCTFIVIAGVGSIDLAAYAAFSAAFGQFAAGLLSIARSANSGLAALPDIKRVQPILDAEPEIIRGKLKPPALSGRIALDDVSFSYPDTTRTIIDRVSLTIEPGEFVAIVGGSGAGKSTLVRMLLGFETPSSGSVLYDGTPLSALDLRAVRRQLGVVLQNVQLTPGSIYDNIACGGAYSRDQVMEAARLAGLADHITAMPMGLETVISEGGATFSGGQRQLILIARALIRKPKIVIFDEATSALDNRTQAQVSASLEAAKATRIVIAHRLSTIRKADRIIVLEHGQIVEQGRFDELIARGGTFFDLAKRQMV